MPENPAVTARRTLVTDLRRYLIGPLDPGERIPEKAVDRYHAGLLSPPRMPIDAEEDEQERGEQEPDSGAGESILALTNVSQQSALGMTFQVQGPARPLVLRTRWAGYAREADKDDPRKTWWVRKPVERTFDLVLSEKAGRKPRMLGDIEGIRVYLTTRHAAGIFTVTVSVVNNRPLRQDWDVDDRIYHDLFNPA